ncbi:MAG TPA: NAD(P)H-dependent oxidoreductase subunit E [Anaerohalosphaeraceae bacterium]|jgi:NADH:ubiquinone oxidoreductase subunit E|nr:NAD(P)H-dependent oxidoreductase subunit E [Anaerohalosphaeraceae bacterium]HRT49830.1 NAD(P)H-dependent oxidoreductase subunit E [Anaerohalosphaeraceae bacterium]HRT87049.1 NAD(P)H-dependent oxidoreductase subunit E [Anaerohalosphaeraceae bacterium]
MEHNPTVELDAAEIAAMLDKHKDGGGLIAVLEDIQERYGYLPENMLRLVSKQSGRSLVDVYGVATFYRSFSLKPRGKHLVCACLGTACHVRGASRTVEELERQLGIKAGETTPDGQFTLETVNCLGACALGPVVVIDGHYFSKVRQSAIGPLLDEARKGFDHAKIGRDNRVFPVTVSCPHCSRSIMDETFEIDGVPSVRVNFACDHRQGWLRLSSLYGSYTIVGEHDIPDNAVVQFRCPHCDHELTSMSNCAMCNAPMVDMLVCGGALQICSRRGCRNHFLDVV